MTTTTRNEAAERLRAHPAFRNKYGVLRLPLVRDLDEALAAERRATVEKVRVALEVDLDIKVTGTFWERMAR